MFERVAILLLIAAGVVNADEPRDAGADAGKALRDPMQPYRPLPGGAGGAAGGATYRFNLTGVVISPTRRIAIVNGRSLEVGDEVAGAKIVRIERETVYLQQGSGALLIHLGRPGNGERPSEGASGP